MIFTEKYKLCCENPLKMTNHSLNIVMKINSHCSHKINTSMEKDFPTVDNFKN